MGRSLAATGVAGRTLPGMGMTYRRGDRVWWVMRGERVPMTVTRVGWRRIRLRGRHGQRISVSPGEIEGLNYGPEPPAPFNMYADLLRG